MKLLFMAVPIMAVPIMALVFSGCGSMHQEYRGIKPVRPKITSSIYASPKSVEHGSKLKSCTPRFQWEGNANGLYDLIIWEVVCCKAGDEELIGRGRKIHYAEKIAGTSYAPSLQLNKHSSYMWSVRDSGSKEWSRYNETINIYMPYVSVKYYGRTFKFRTP